MMKSSWLLHRRPEFALRRRGFRRVRRRRVSAEGARASSSVCRTIFANADRMFDCPVRLRLTRKPGRPTALPPSTASTGRDRQLVAQGITKQTPSKYPNICPKWTDKALRARDAGAFKNADAWTALCGSTFDRTCFLRSDCEESTARRPILRRHRLSSDTQWSHA